MLIQKSESVSFHEPSEAQDEYASANILNFSEPKYEYGYKVRELASLIEDDLLSSFLSNISNNDDAMEALSTLDEKGISSESDAGIIVQNIMTQANEQGIFGKADSADADDTGDEFAQQDTEDMPDDFDPPEVESKLFKDWVESVADDKTLFEEIVVSEDEFVDFNRALATAKERMGTLPRMGDGSPLIRKIKGMCEEVGIEYDVKAEDLYAALSGEDVINEGEPRQYKGDGTDAMVVKDDKVEVIDAKDLDAWLADGWLIAEARNDELDRVTHLAGIEPVIEDDETDEEEQIDEAQSEAQKAAFQKMLDAKNGDKEETTEDADADDDDEVEESIELDRVKHLAGV